MTYYPLTTPQHNIWKLQKYYEHTAIGNIIGMLTFDDNCSYDMSVLLEQAINSVIKRSDSLRIRLIDDNGTIKQHFSEYVHEQIPVKDYSAYTQEEVMRILQNEAEEPLPVLCQPLYRFSIIKYKKQYSIFLVIHHLICDGWSANLLANQLASYVHHAGKTDGEESPFFAYTRFIDEEEKYRQSRRFVRDEAYWDAFAQGYSEPSYIKPQMSGSNSVKASRHIYTVSRAETERIYGYCAANGISPDTLYKTAMAIYLYNLNHVPSVVIGTPVLNRDGAVARNTVGMYVSTMPVALQIDETANIRSHMDQCVSNAREMFRHCKYAYSDILSVTKHYHNDVTKLFDVMISYENSSISNDALIAMQWLFQGYSENSLTLHIDDRNSDLCLDISYDYQVHLFQTEMEVELLAKRIQFIIQQIIDDDEQKVRDIRILPVEEYNRIVCEFNDTASCDSCEKCMVSLYSLVEKQNAGRIIDGKQEHSLAELRRDAEKIDAAVRGEKRVIGVLCERSYAELAAIYGIVRGGNAYLPVSPDYPRERIQLLLEQSNCRTVLAQRKYRHLVQDALVIEDILEDDMPSAVPPVSALPDDPLYVLFTSGSTGTPKGAVVSNRSAVNRIQWMCEKYFSPETVVMLKTPFTFDVSVWEIFGFAIGGFTLYILPPEDHYRQDRVLDHIRRGKVTDLHFVPTVFSYFLDVLKKDGGQVPSLKNIFLSGEALSASLVNRAPAMVHNLYGPTECAVDVTYYDCAKTETDPVPIGRPIDNCQMYVLDQQLQPVPVGIVGQIFIGGTPVGMGYVNDAKKTSDVFVPNPYADGRLYRTGDLGYWREDGELIFVGRADNQVKIHGQRIELGEIEAALNAFVTASVAVLEGGRLLAFYTGDERIDLREQLGRILPHHMIPNRFIRVDEMPMTASGKIDRNALTAVKYINHDYVPPIGKTEESICTLFSRVLEAKNVGRNDNFYDLGGTSLSMMELLCEAPLESLSPSEFMLDPTPSGLAMRVMNSESSSSLAPLYIPDRAVFGYILCPYAGGDAAAYTALVAEFRKRKVPVSLYFVPWGCNYDYVSECLHALSIPVGFYSHCAGAVIAMELQERMECVRKIVVGANIPPADLANIWCDVPDQDLMTYLRSAGMPELLREEEMLKQFRVHTDEYFRYIQKVRAPSASSIELVLGRQDPFTEPLHGAAEELWKRYVSGVTRTHVIDTASHYFQATHSATLADILLEEI